MLNVEIEKKLELINMSIKIQQSDAPRITAMRILPNPRIKILYLISDIGAELSALLVTIVWAIAVSMPDHYIGVLPTYHALLGEASHAFWAFCWWVIAMIKLAALITGNLYVRRTGFALGMVAWVATLVVLYTDLQSYNLLVGLALAFFITSVWNYAKAGLMLSQRLEYLDSQETNDDN